MFGWTGWSAHQGCRHRTQAPRGLQPRLPEPDGLFSNASNPSLPWEHEPANLAALQPTSGETRETQRKVHEARAASLPREPTPSLASVAGHLHGARRTRVAQCTVMLRSANVSPSQAQEREVATCKPASQQRHSPASAPAASPRFGPAASNRHRLPCSSSSLGATGLARPAWADGALVPTAGPTAIGAHRRNPRGPCHDFFRGRAALTRETCRAAAPASCRHYLDPSLGQMVNLLCSPITLEGASGRLPGYSLSCFLTSLSPSDML